MKTITLPANPKADLHWEKILEEAQASKGKIIWQLEFGWKETPLNIWDTAHFQSYFLAVEECVKALIKFYPNKKHSLSFLKIVQPFQKYLVNNELLELRYIEFLGNRKHDSLLFELFCASLISEYLHRLASILPEEFSSYITFEFIPWPSTAFFAQVFCQRRFAHFKKFFCKQKLSVNHPQASIGIVLPQDQYIDAKTLEQLNRVLEILSGDKLKFSCIPEELLNQSWEGIEDLILIKASLSDLGMRMLHGFVAAGGSIVTIDSKIGFENEISFDTMLKKLGIKT